MSAYTKTRWACRARSRGTMPIRETFPALLEPNTGTNNDMLYLPAQMCRDLAAASKREWLETNGLGGFASSTITGLNTRRYHGLLCAALEPPAKRFLLLSKLEETLVVDGNRYELSANRYPGVVHPQGFLLL